MALTQSQILRHHVMYQTSYTGNCTPRPYRSLSPLRREPILKKRPKQKTALSLPSTKCETRKDATPKRRIFKSLAEELDYRRKTRAERTRPWQDKVPRLQHRNTKVQLFYDKTLPSSFIDDEDLTIKPRKYVANTKYGNIYEIREVKTPKKTESPTPRKWIWEDEYQFWMKESRDRYLQEHGSKAKPRVMSGTPGSTPRTSRPDSLPSVQDKPKDRPTADIYVAYNYHRLERTRRKVAVTILQRMFRGWYIRTFIAKLKQKALIDHGRTWSKFISEYRELVAKIQSRYGVMKPSCPTVLKHINTFMDKKKTYEVAFRKIAPSGKLHKDDLMEFFKRCGLWPTQKDINKSFDTIFKGSRNTAEVVFLLDCSTSTGMVGFNNLIKFVRDVVMCLDVAPDRTRVGVVPFNEDVFSSFGISAFDNKREVLDAISKIKIRHGLTRTDLALRLMTEMFKDARPGVQKLGIVITDGKSIDSWRMKKEAKTVHEMGIEVFSIGIGNKVDEDELHYIASSAKHVHKAMDVRSLNSIKRQIEKRFCIAACGFCQHLLPRILKHGLLQHEVLDVLWTTYPPEAAGLTCTRVPPRFTLDSPNNAPIILPSSSHVCRPINQSEALDVVWTCYPPEACGLQHVRFSRWIRPVIGGKEAWSLLDDDIIRATGMKACLRLVIQSKLERNGYITVPSDVKEGVEQVTSETQVMQIVENFMKDKLV